MSFGRYELFIQGEKFGDHDSLEDVFQIIDSCYQNLEYSDTLWWKIEDFTDDGIRVCTKRMDAGLWYAYAETPQAFAMWLELFGWSERSASLHHESQP